MPIAFSNGSSIPPRLPGLSAVLRSLNGTSSSTTYTIVALSYRGFWTCSGRPSESGIKLYAAAALSWVAQEFPPESTDSGEEVRLVLWGQSLGAGVAVDAAATAISTPSGQKDCVGTRIDGLLLETPFVSVKAMLLELYPQKWLPYRYLGPFLRNHWDSKEALRRLFISYETLSVELQGRRPLKTLILQAGKDELVPAGQSLELEDYARKVGLDVQRIDVKGALHNEVTVKSSGRAAIVAFLREMGV